MHIYYYKESEEKRMSDIKLPFTSFKFLYLLYSRVGAGAAGAAGAGAAGAAGAVAASKFSPGAGAA
jgi:hypothetical protein